MPSTHGSSSFLTLQCPSARSRSCVVHLQQSIVPYSGCKARSHCTSRKCLQSNQHFWFPRRQSAPLPALGHVLPLVLADGAALRLLLRGGELHGSSPLSSCATLVLADPRQQLAHLRAARTTDVCVTCHQAALEAGASDGAVLPGLAQQTQLHCVPCTCIQEPSFVCCTVSVSLSTPGL